MALDLGLRGALLAERVRLREAGDDHFYGAWNGGRKAEGGHADVGGGTATAAKGDDAAPLIAAMQAKYPGTQWADLAKVEPTLRKPVTDEIDGLIGRYGPPPNFRGLRVEADKGGIIAEVKHVTHGEPGSAMYLYGSRWTTPGKLQGEALHEVAVHPKWGVDVMAAKAAPKGQEGVAYGRAIIAHEMGHEYLGLNLHSRLGADRNAAVRQELEPFLHKDFFPNLGKAHVSQYARKNPHEAWAELWTAANGHGPASQSHYPAMLKAILDKHYPPGTSPVKEAAAEADDGVTQVTVMGASGPSCGWALAHPEADAIVRPMREASSDDHPYGAWRGGSKAQGGHPAYRPNPSGNGTLMSVGEAPKGPARVPASWSGVENAHLLAKGAHVGLVRAAGLSRGYVERFDGDNLIMRLENGSYRQFAPGVVRRVNDVPQSSVVREGDVPLAEKKSVDDHFYGPWLGGSKVDGGHMPIGGKNAGEVHAKGGIKGDIFASEKVIAKRAKQARRSAASRLAAEAKLVEDWVKRQGMSAEAYARYLGEAFASAPLERVTA